MSAERALDGLLVRGRHQSLAIGDQGGVEAGVDEGASRDATEALDVVASDLLGKCCAIQVGGLGGLQRLATATALDDRLLEQALRHRRGEVTAHGESTGGLAEDRHVVGIATECLGVVAHPLQRGNLIGEAVVPRSRVVLGQHVASEEAKRAEAVVDADDHSALRCETVADVVRLMGGAGREPATVEPDHHREILSVFP